MDAELRSLERLLARGGFKLYLLTSGAHSDHGVETLVWGPVQDHEWFKARWVEWKAKEQVFWNALRDRLPHSADPELAAERTKGWEIAVAAWRTESGGGTFEGHLALLHGFLVPESTILYLGDV